MVYSIHTFSQQTLALTRFCWLFKSLVLLEISLQVIPQKFAVWTNAGQGTSTIYASESSRCLPTLSWSRIVSHQIEIIVHSDEYRMRSNHLFDVTNCGYGTLIQNYKLRSTHIMYFTPELYVATLRFLCICKINRFDFHLDKLIELKTIF